MTRNSSIEVDPDTTLADLNGLVAREERVHGKLLKIGNDGVNTTLVFENTPVKPAKNAVITPDVAGAPSVPAGNTSFDHNNVFIASVSTPASASR